LVWLSAIFLALLIACSCQAELYSGLTEEEANRMMVVLLNSDLNAAKINQGKNGFSLAVESDQVALALELLSTHGFPRIKHENLGQVFSGQGMISTPLEEQSRLAFALSQELSETFSRLDGVLAARVHVVLQSRDQSGAVYSPATAAVVIRHLPDSPVVNLTAKIKEVSSKSVPGLSEDLVSVMLVPSRVEVILPEGRSDSSILTSPRFLVAAFLVLALVSLLVRRKLASRKLALQKTNESKPLSDHKDN
jgi:type III secretion protein J